MSVYLKMLEGFRNSYLGFATLAIIGQSCLGSVAAMYILMNGTSHIQMAQLTAVVMICMLVNGSILSQQKPKIVFNLLITSTITSVLFIVWNVLLK